MYCAIGVEPTKLMAATRFLPQPCEPERGRRILLAGLEDDGVARCDGDGGEPQRDHRGEVEGADDADDAQRLLEGVDVDSAGSVL